MARQRGALLELEELGRRLEQCSARDTRSTSPSLDRKSMMSRYIWCLRQELEAARKRTKDMEDQLAGRGHEAILEPSVDAVEQAHHQYSPRRLPRVQHPVLSPVGKLAGALVEAKAAREKIVLVEQLVHEAVGAAALEEQCDEMPAHGDLHSAGTNCIDSLVANVAEVTRQLELKEAIVAGRQVELSHINEELGASLHGDVGTHGVMASLELRLALKEAECKEQEITIAELQHRLNALQEENERLLAQQAAAVRENEAEVKGARKQLHHVRELCANVAAVKEEAAIVRRLQGETDNHLAFGAARIPASFDEGHPRMMASVQFNASCGLDAVLTEPPFADEPQGYISSFAASERANQYDDMWSTVRYDSVAGSKVKVRESGKVFHLVASPAVVEIAPSATRYTSEQPEPCTICVTACTGRRQEEALDVGICNKLATLKDERHVANCPKTLERGWWSVGSKLLSSIAIVGVVGLGMVHSPILQHIPSVSPLQNGYLQQSEGFVATPGSPSVNTTIATLKPPRLASTTEDAVSLTNTPLRFGMNTFTGAGPVHSMVGATVEQAQTLLGHPQYAGSAVPAWLLNGATQIDKLLERRLVEVEETTGLAGKDTTASEPNAMTAGAPTILASVLEALSVKEPSVKASPEALIVATSPSLLIIGTAEADLPALAIEVPEVVQPAEMAETHEPPATGSTPSIIEGMMVAEFSSFAPRPFGQNTSSEKKPDALDPVIADASPVDGFPTKGPSAEATEALTAATSPAAVVNPTMTDIATVGSVSAKPKRPCVRKIPTKYGCPKPQETTVLPNVSASVMTGYKIQNLPAALGTAHAPEMITADTSASRAMGVISVQENIGSLGQHLANKAASKAFLAPMPANHKSTMDVHSVSEAPTIEELAAQLSNGPTPVENVAASLSSHKVDALPLDMDSRTAPAEAVAYRSMVPGTVTAVDKGLGAKAPLGKASQGTGVLKVVKARQGNAASASSSVATGTSSMDGVQSSAAKLMYSLHWAGLSLCGTVTAAVSALLWRDRSLHRQGRWKSVWAVGPDEGVFQGS